MVNLKIGEATLRDIGLVIFDKDGTIMELYHYWSRMVFHRALFICERLGLDRSHVRGLGYAMGVDWDAKRLRPEGPVGLKKREIVMEAAVNYLRNLGYDGVEDICLEVFRDVDAYSLNNLEEFIKPIEGAADLIKSLYERGCLVAIATTDLSERAKIAVRHLGLEAYLHLIVGAEMVKRPKPHPDQIEFVLKALSVEKKHALMVGDAISDVEMGLNAGIRGAVGLLTGFGKEEEFLKITPLVVPDISHIKIA